MGQDWATLEDPHHQPTPGTAECLRMGGSVAGPARNGADAQWKSSGILGCIAPPLSTPARLHHLALRGWRRVAQGRRDQRIHKDTYAIALGVSTPVSAGP